MCTEKKKAKTESSRFPKGHARNSQIFGARGVDAVILVVEDGLETRIVHIKLEVVLRKTKKKKKKKKK